jgi:hypothetical protein
MFSYPGLVRNFRAKRSFVGGSNLKSFSRLSLISSLVLIVYLLKTLLACELKFAETQNTEATLKLALKLGAYFLNFGFGKVLRSFALVRAVSWTWAG